MKDEICKNCAHEEWYHGDYVEEGKKPRILCLGGNDCPCEKFEPIARNSKEALELIKKAKRGSTIIFDETKGNSKEEKEILKKVYERNPCVPEYMEPNLVYAIRLSKKRKRGN